jgi:hypothetical protein
MYAEIRRKNFFAHDCLEYPERVLGDIKMVHKQKKDLWN